MGDCSNDHELFPELLRRLAEVVEDKEENNGSKFSNAYEDELLSLLLQSAVNCKAALSHWQQMYRSYLPASAAFLKHLCELFCLFAFEVSIILNLCFF